METETFRDFYGRIIGYIETDKATGNKIARDFYRRIIGRYDSKLNRTTDFYGRVIAQGNALAGLIWAEEAKRKDNSK